MPLEIEYFISRRDWNPRYAQRIGRYRTMKSFCDQQFTSINRGDNRLWILSRINIGYTHIMTDFSPQPQFRITVVRYEGDLRRLPCANRYYMSDEKGWIGYRAIWRKAQGAACSGPSNERHVPCFVKLWDAAVSNTSAQDKLSWRARNFLINVGANS